ncbi:hypothetical protein [Pseudonocardia sp. NPDC049635]|uniref:hypothetical protein n=1 Tax=Pseudonocardia sp. NPDC049635 TaxID=3155506 RepID=UPI003408B538
MTRARMLFGSLTAAGCALVGLVAVLTAAGPWEPAEPVLVRHPDPAGSTATESLAALDPCRILDGAVAALPAGADPAGRPPGSRSDHGVCSLGGHHVGSDLDITLTLGEEFDAPRRWGAAPVEAAGFRAFREESVPDRSGGPSTGLGFCRVSLPVGFTHAVSVEVGQRWGAVATTPMCPVAERVATGVADQVTSASRETGAVAVRRAFGPAMNPALLHRNCRYASPDHEIEVELTLVHGFDYSEYARRSPDPVQEVEINGHPARFVEGAPSPWGEVTRDWYVRPFPGPRRADDPRTGALMLQTVVRPPRGLDVLRDDPGHDLTVGRRGEQVIADLIAEHLG